MKLQLRDADDMKLLGEADVEGLTFQVRGEEFVCKENIHFDIIADGYLMPQAFLVDKHGHVVRVIDMQLTSKTVRPGSEIDVPDFRWLFGR